MKALPKTIFVRREEDGNETYLVPGEKFREHMALEETRTVGEYKLVKTYKVSAELQIEEQ